MQAIAKAHEWLINALKTLAGIIVFIIFVLITLDVLLPLANIQPWEGTLGVVEYGLLWFTILAAPWLARIKGHVFIDAVKVMLSSSRPSRTSSAGTGLTGPSLIARAGRAACGSMSQCALPRVCQSPFMSGWPAAVRGISPLWALRSPATKRAGTRAARVSRGAGFTRG